MREILFRGKRLDNGEWVEGFLIHDEFCNTFIPYIGYLMGDDTDVTEVIPATVGQYTGLTDKNGKKIFEGDIVKTHYANAPKCDFVETVVFHNGKFCALTNNGGGKQWAPLWDGVPHVHFDKSVYMDSVEVIGNIHDKPELLEVY